MSNSRKNIQRSKPTVLNGVPNKYEGQNGDVIYRRVGRSVNQYVKEGNEWKKMASTDSLFDKEETSSKEAVKTLTVGLVNNQTEDFIKKDGSRDFTGNQSFGGNNITNVGTLDVDGATTLDQTSINTADGAFAVSGANPINLTTTGANKITLTSANDIDITPTGDLDIDANNVTVDTSREYTGTHAGNVTVTGSANMTTQATGSAANTLLIQNTNNHGSSFTGLHLKTDSGGASSGYNRILMECDNVAAKGADYGIDIRSENNIRLRAENANNGNATGLLMRATGPIDIGVASSITPHTSNNRVKIHGTFETSNLWRDSNAPIIMDKSTIEAGSALGSDTSGEYTKFEALDTQKLMRNFTYKAEGSLNANDYLKIVHEDNDDSGNGTVWLVTVAFNNGVYEGLSVGYCFRINNTLVDPADMSSYVVHYYQGGGTFGAITWDASNGIRYQNLISLSTSVAVKASAQRIQSTDDFS